ncbi:MAG: metal ABC transporter ATP-binding protein [Candidatus Bathyarchaeia archaeon]
MENVILRVEGLSVRLNGEDVLMDLSFNVYEGEVLAILGPNGAGKTTLLKALLGIVPYEGVVEWREGVKVGYVPQRLPFIKDVPLSVKEFFRLMNASERKTAEILNSIGLGEEILERRIGDLSSGQFQRILIGWALASDPNVLLFDEPLAGIDIGGQESVYNFLERLKAEKNLTILFVTHELSIVYRLADRVLCLNKRMLCSGAPKEKLTPEAISNLYASPVKFYQHKHEEGEIS